MSIDLRMPSINGNDREQLIQIRSYLYQLIPQLQWALNNVNVSGVSSDAVMQTTRVIGSSSSGSSSSGSSLGSMSAESVFSTLKPLIIKSADIVQAYYEEINKRLEGVYVAESDFGTYVEQTSLDIEETSKYVNQKYSDVQAIITTEVGAVNSKIEETSGDVKNLSGEIDAANTAMDSLKTYVLNTQAYIKTGRLDENAVPPVYGVEVGQTDVHNGEAKYTRYARFTSNRLSFFDQNDIEVAYISNYKLYIGNAEITISFKIGGLKDTVMENGDVVRRWAGRG